MPALAVPSLVEYCTLIGELDKEHATARDAEPFVSLTLKVEPAKSTTAGTILHSSISRPRETLRLCGLRGGNSLPFNGRRYGEIHRRKAAQMISKEWQKNTEAERTLPACHWRESSRRSIGCGDSDGE